MAIRRRKKGARDKGLTTRYHSGALEDDRIDRTQKFGQRSRHAEKNKTARTAQMRAEAAGLSEDFSMLPIGLVVQVFSLFCEVIADDGTSYLCTVRKTLAKVQQTHIVVGDRVRIRPTGMTHESGKPEAVVEQILPRQTVLTRTDSFSSRLQDPVVANAEQMLIVASLVKPRIKWGLIDRMLIAAQAGGLTPILCINKIDLLKDEEPDVVTASEEALAAYASMETRILRTSVLEQVGITELRELLQDRVTVLAGHSGVGKSSLIRAVQPALDLRVGEISTYTDKGRHTTTSARHYPLETGGAVIDTPGVKMFGLWDVTADTLIDYFPDVDDETASPARQQSYDRILASLQS